MNLIAQQLLAALIPGPNYGAGLADRVKTTTKGRYEIGPASLYGTLKDLEQEGLVHSWEEEGPSVRGGRPRKYYELTGKGRMVALEEREAASGLWGLMVPGVAT